jgi:hypothetical protein
VESKKETRAAWDAALKKDSPSNIIAALRRQLPHMRQQVRGGANYNKHAKRWLSHEMWREPVPTSGNQPKAQRPDDSWMFRQDFGNPLEGIER